MNFPTTLFVAKHIHTYLLSSIYADVQRNNALKRMGDVLITNSNGVFCNLRQITLVIRVTISLVYVVAVSLGSKTYTFNVIRVMLLLCF